MPKHEERVLSLDGLRGLGALTVFLYHIDIMVKPFGGCSYSFVNWEMLSVRPNRGMLTPGHSAGGLQSARCVSARLRKAPCLA